MEFLTEYGLFLAKSVTLVVAILLVIGFAVSVGQRQAHAEKGHMQVTRLNDKYEQLTATIKEAVFDEHQLKLDTKASKDKTKKEAKEQKAKLKQSKLADEDELRKPRLFVLNFHGDIRASAVEQLREEITSILGIAKSRDEILVKLESGGGMVHSYGLASSQLDRIKQKQIPLTVCVDKVAASGGYMMACVADRVIAAPFAILGSIGVVAQLPNFHRLLKKNDIDFELLTAGDHKRTLTMFGENTDKDREKFMEDLEDTHTLFKEFVAEHRPEVVLDQVANGDVWFGRRALENNLVDELKTSDAYIAERVLDADVFEVRYVLKKSIQEKLGLATESGIDRAVTRWLDRFRSSRYMS